MGDFALFDFQDFGVQPFKTLRCLASKALGFKVLAAARLVSVGG